MCTRGTWPAGALALAAAGLVQVTGCRAIDPCAAGTVACGGSPVGRWQMIDSCQDPTWTPPLQRTHLGQTVTTARQPPPEPASADWCADLKYEGPSPGRITALNLPRDTPRIQAGGLLAYGADNNYGAFVASSITTSIEFSWRCITRFGYASGCAEFGQALAVYATGLGVINNTSCEDGASGCRCAYTSQSDAAGTNLQGTFSVDGNLLTHFAGSSLLPSQVEFCQDGDAMTLWGHARTNILDLPGVRTLTLQRIVCGNGVLERGEECEPPGTDTCDANCLIIQAS